MGAPAKFLFDLDFSTPDKSRERAATSAEITARIAQAEKQAYRAGFEAAQRESKAESERRAALAFEQIGNSIQGIASRFSEIEGRLQDEAVNVAIAAARKLCNELIADEPLSEVGVLVSECLRQLVSTPHLVIRINEQLYEQAHAHFERMAKQSGDRKSVV